MRGQQDSLIQKWQHAEVQPQSTPGSTGSSTSPTQLNNGSQVAQQSSGTQVASSGPSSGPSATPTVSAPATVATSTTTPTSVVPASASSTTVIWISPSSGTWETGQNWSTQAVPPATDTVQINLPLTVIVNAPESVASLVVGAGAIVDIVSGGALTITTAIDNNGLVKINSSGTDPTLSIKGTVQLLDGGQIEMVGPATQNMILGVAGSGATLVNVNNTIVGSGTIGQGDRALTLVNDSGGTIEALNGTLTIDTGNTFSNSGLVEVAAGGTLQVQDNINNSGSIQVISGGTLLLAGVTITGGTITNSGLFEVTGNATLSNDVFTNTGGTLQIDSGETLTLNSTTITGGTITDGGQIELSGSSTITGGASLDGGQLTVESGQTADARQCDARWYLRHR